MDTKKIQTIPEKELVNAICYNSGHSSGQVRKILSSMKEHITKELKSGNAVKLGFFGKFTPFYRAPRQVKNPRNKQMMEVKGLKLIKFRASKALKDTVKDTYDN